MITTTTPLTLNTGATMPPVGFGTWQVGRKEVVQAGLAGYRAFDTATFYSNESGVGAGISEAGLDRKDVFLTTKVWRSDMGYASTHRAFERSRSQLGVDVVDLYLIHWPHPNDDTNVETWRAMEELRDAGKVVSIGVSNFDERDLDLIARHSQTVPAVNQIELNPLRPRTTLHAENEARGIVTTAWSPLGQGGPVLRDRTLTTIAKAHGVAAAQVALRWLLQKRIVAIPRSSDPRRIAQNIDLDGFALTEDEVQSIDALSR